MAHDRDHDHPPVPPRDKAPPLVSRLKPDSRLEQHPSLVPGEPRDPKVHPGRA